MRFQRCYSRICLLSTEISGCIKFLSAVKELIVNLLVFQLTLRVICVRFDFRWRLVLLIPLIRFTQSIRSLFSFSTILLHSFFVFRDRFNQGNWNYKRLYTLNDNCSNWGSSTIKIKWYFVSYLICFRHFAKFSSSLFTKQSINWSFTCHVIFIFLNKNKMELNQLIPSAVSKKNSPLVFIYSWL